MRYFKTDEFNCPCCNKNEMDKEFLELLDNARGYADISFVVSSGYRCNLHNKEVGGSESSSHLKGLAVDLLSVGSTQRYKILTGLTVAGFTRIGIGDSFIHADRDGSKAQKVAWLYN